MSNLSEEEKKAIDYYINNEYSFGFETDMDIESFKKAIGIEETDEDTWEKHQIRFKTLLNLIEKQQKELDKKDKIISEIKSKLEKHIQFCEQEASSHLENNVCHISLEFDKSLLDITKQVEGDK